MTRTRILRPATLSGIHLEYSVSLLLLHLLALLALVPWLFSWVGFWALVAGTLVIGQGVPLVYHRLLTHRSFEVPRWCEHFLVTLSVFCLEGSPASWVATHRLHHQASDTRADAHSPMVSLLWAHLGWILRRNPGIQGLAVREKYARDVLADPYYRALESRSLRYGIYVLHCLAYFCCGVVVGWLTYGTAMAAVQLGASLLVWGAILRTVVVWHLTWIVNSVGHRVGYQNHQTGDSSRNNLLLGYLTLGEGWHNNHHHDPSSASNRYRWWELDLIYNLIQLLGMLGIARRIIPPAHVRRRSSGAAPERDPELSTPGQFSAALPTPTGVAPTKVAPGATGTD